MPILTTRSSVPRASVERVHRGAHAQARNDRMFGLDERRHHGIADRFDDGALFRRDDFQQRVEMRAHQIERGEIADPLVQRGRSLQIGEQEGQRRDLEALIDAEIVGLEHVAEGLVRQHPLGGEERLPLADQMMHHIARDKDRRQRPDIGLIFERQSQRSRTHGPGSTCRRRGLVDTPATIADVPWSARPERR